jgi:hypothetical protein
MLALTCEETEVVVTVKAAFTDPAGTVTEAGTPAAEELLLSATLAPPLGAALDSVTVPCDCVPPVTLAGFTVSDESDGPGGGGLTVRSALWLEPPRLAPIVALTAEETDVVDTVKLALDEPAGTVTETGTVAAEALLDSATERPPAGAAPERVTVA